MKFQSKYNGFYPNEIYFSCRLEKIARFQVLMCHGVNPFDAESGIFMDYTMATDAMAPCVVRLSAAMVLNMKYISYIDIWAPVFCEGGFRLPV